MKFKDRELIKDERIIIFSSNMRKKYGAGKYFGDEKMKVGNKKYLTPVFKIGNKIIHGFECWWIPEKEAKEIKKEMKK